jgi:hypothetical protein
LAGRIASADFKVLENKNCRSNFDGKVAALCGAEPL